MENDNIKMILLNLKPCTKNIDMQLSKKKYTTYIYSSNFIFGYWDVGIVSFGYSFKVLVVLNTTNNIHLDFSMFS